MTRSSIVVALGVVLLVSPLLLAQTPAPNPQAAGGPPPKSTAFIVGQVVDGSTGQPIAEAVVTMRQLGGRGANRGRGGPGAGDIGLAAAGGAANIADIRAQLLGGRGNQLEQRLLTGGDGRFLFHSLPPGQFQLTATLSGYSATLTGSMGMAAAILGGGMTTGEAPSTVTLTEGQQLNDVKLRLWKHAAITGSVVDDGGEPAIGLTLQAMQRIMIAGRARYAPAGSGKTDDRGMYRIASILPGDYIVVLPQAPTAVPAGLMESTVKSLMSMSQTGSAGGGGADVMGLAELMSSGVNIQAASTGVRIGDYMVASASGALPILAADGRVFAYQTAFYAGVSVPVQASVVTLKSGEERAGVDFQLRLTPTFRISGTVTGPGGPVSTLGMRLVVPGDGVTSDSEFDVAATVTTSDGRFSFFGVPPGQFLLRAQKEARPEIPGVANVGIFNLNSPGGPVKSMFGQANVTVGSSDIDNLVFEMAEGFVISGRLEFEASKTGRQPPPSLANAAIMLAPADGRTPSLFSMARPNKVTETRTFQTGNNAPGKYFLTLQGVPPPWQILTATIGGRDVLDAPLDLRGDVTDVLLTLTDEQLTLSGTVTATAGQKPADAIIYFFPADYRAWIANGMNPRRSRTTRPAGGNTYASGILPRGDYLAVAIDRADEGDLQDPAFIETLSRVATRVSLVNEKQTLDLTTARVRR